MLDLIIAIIVLTICYFTGSTIEKNHYKKIRTREIALMRNLYINFNKNIKSKRKIKHIELVSGNVVLGCDAFKSFVESLKSFFGGNIASLESVLDRGRREALLRIREKAYLLGAHIVTNVKIETIVLDPLGTEKGAKVSVMAYGTAIKYVQN